MKVLCLSLHLGNLGRSGRDAFEPQPRPLSFPLNQATDFPRNCSPPGPTATNSLRHLALSTNNIAAITNLAGLENLKILSLGRNMIKKFDNIEAVSETIEEIWISYNLIESLSGLDKAKNLKKLFMSNNLVGKWTEIEKLQANTALEEVLFVGNPFVDEDNAAYRIQMLRTLPQLKKIDGLPMDVDEREAAQAAE